MEQTHFQRRTLPITWICFLVSFYSRHHTHMSQTFHLWPWASKYVLGGYGVYLLVRDRLEEATWDYSYCVQASSDFRPKLPIGINIWGILNIGESKYTIPPFSLRFALVFFCFPFLPSRAHREFAKAQFKSPSSMRRWIFRGLAEILLLRDHLS